MLNEYDRMRTWRLVCLVAALGLGGCTKPNPRSCADGLCTDQQFPFCDVNGTLGGQAGECIAVTCNPGELAECRGDLAVICNATGNDYDLVECELGCNEAIGACVSPDDPRVRLTYQIAKTTAPTGGADPELGYAAIPGVAVRLGPVDGDLVAASYDPSDGSISYPSGLQGTTWRLEYQFDGRAYEAQWAPEAGKEHLVVPEFGRLDPAAIPENSGYRFTPTGPGAPTNSVFMSVIATGLWMRTDLGSTSAPFRVAFDGMTPLIGRVGVPDPNQGETVVVLRNMAGSICGSRVDGTTTLGALPLAANTDTEIDPDPFWVTTTTTATFNYA